MLPSCNSRHIQFIHGVVLLTLPRPNRHLGSRSPVCHRPQSTPLYALCASMQCCSGLGKASTASVSPACSLRATVAACRSRSCVPQRCNALNRTQHQQSEQQQQQSEKQQMLPSWSPFAASFAMYLLTEAPAMAEAGSSPFAGVQSSSLYVTLALFLMSVPGIWSQVKRAPTAKKVRKTFEVPGPAAPGAPSLDARAAQIFGYFKRYNYAVKGTGEVITFEGVYAPDKGQAAAVTFYTFAGMASVALVLSIVFPSVGNYWYGLTALSPAAYIYYMSRAERVEQVRVKMVTSDDEMTTDVTFEGDQEEIERLRKELNFMEKGKVYVKGLLEQQ